MVCSQSWARLWIAELCLIEQSVEIRDLSKTGKLLNKNASLQVAQRSLMEKIPILITAVGVRRVNIYASWILGASAGFSPCGKLRKTLDRPPWGWSVRAPLLLRLFADFFAAPAGPCSNSRRPCGVFLRSGRCVTRGDGDWPRFSYTMWGARADYKNPPWGCGHPVGLRLEGSAEPPLGLGAAFWRWELLWILMLHGDDYKKLQLL